MSLYHDLVAGDGVPGYQDGEFYRARFRFPSGLALLDGGAVLAVADRDNHRIRLVRLNEGNRVETLAGSGVPGGQDGPLPAATFNQPTAMAAISPHVLLVNDEGNALFRLIDLEKQRVETIAGSGARGVSEGAARSVALGGVTSLVYSVAETAVFFAQPDSGAVRRFDLTRGTVRNILLQDPRVPHPSALAIFKGKLCVADLNGQVVRVAQTSPAFSGKRGIESFGRQEGILAMIESDGDLYAVAAGTDDAFVRIDTGTAWPQPSVLAESIPVPYLRFADDDPVGLVADPRSPRSFFLDAPANHEVLCVKDYRFHDFREAAVANPNGLEDFDYPMKKPPGTFRILMVGDSRVNFSFDPPYRTQDFEVERMETMPKRLELMLNTIGALENSRLRYEVLTLMRVSWEPLLVWSAHEAPEIARKFDVDLVLLMQPTGGNNTFQAYLDRPITAGLPSDTVDMEYRLKPLEERLAGNPAAALIERAKTLGWIDVLPNGTGLEIERIGVLSTDEIARRELLELYARPLGALRKGLNAGRKGAGPRLLLCYFPLGSRWRYADEAPFWKDLTEKVGAEYLDLSAPFVTLRESWYPMSQAGGTDHFTPDGHAFMAFLLTHELLRNGLVPARAPGSAEPSRPETAAPPSP